MRVVHLLAAIVVAIVTLLVTAMLLHPATDRGRNPSRRAPHDHGQRLATVELFDAVRPPA